jgi:hypothetical protein
MLPIFLLIPLFHKFFDSNHHIRVKFDFFFLDPLKIHVLFGLPNDFALFMHFHYPFALTRVLNNRGFLVNTFHSAQVEFHLSFYIVKI